MGADERPKVTDYLRVADLTPTELTHILDVSAKMKQDHRGWLYALQGQTLACFFEKPSTRTRVSFEGAAHRLGMLPIMLRPDELQLGRGEPIADTARVLAGYSAAIVIRTFAQALLQEIADAADVPVINALTDDHHPCQALADLLTVREVFGSLSGVKVAYIGDGNNVAHSLMEAGALAGMHVVVASPPGFEPNPEVLARSRAIAGTTGGHVEVVSDPADACHGAQAIYTDVWVSMGQDDDTARRLKELDAFRVTGALMEMAAPDAIFLHCLPAHRGQEVAADVIDGPRSRVWQQAANRLPTEQAVVFTLVTGVLEGER
jgi:ornithine carbamoyltransferase